MKKYYVDSKKGLDSNEGSESSPFATVQRALQQIVADGTVQGDGSLYLSPGDHLLPDGRVLNAETDACDDLFEWPGL